jgi:hypothetical protein
MKKFTHLSKMTVENAERRLLVWQKMINVPVVVPGRTGHLSITKTNLAHAAINIVDRIRANAPGPVQRNSTGELVTLEKMEPESRGIM